MNTSYTAHSFRELQDFIDNFPHLDYMWLYRGQADASWQLKPKSGRDEFNKGGTGLGRFRAWKRKAVAHNKLPENEWEKLAIAQHYGLATFMLDWTENPLVAAFFACFQYPEKDAMIFVHTPGGIIDLERIKSPFEIDEALKNGYSDFLPSLGFYPNAIDKRIINQKGVFTIHVTPQNELKSYSVSNPDMEANLFGIRIKAEAKNDIIKKIQKYGIDSHFLFPDLAGLSWFVNTKTKSMVANKKY